MTAAAPERHLEAAAHAALRSGRYTLARAVLDLLLAGDEAELELVVHRDVNPSNGTDSRIAAAPASEVAKGEPDGSALERAVEYFRANPEASLRDCMAAVAVGKGTAERARKVSHQVSHPPSDDVSHGTARDVSHGTVGPLPPQTPPSRIPLSTSLDLSSSSSPESSPESCPKPGESAPDGTELEALARVPRDGEWGEFCFECRGAGRHKHTCPWLVAVFERQFGKRAAALLEQLATSSSTPPPAPAESAVVPAWPRRGADLPDTMSAAALERVATRLMGTKAPAPTDLHARKFLSWHRDNQPNFVWDSEQKVEERFFRWMCDQQVRAASSSSRAPNPKRPPQPGTARHLDAKGVSIADVLPKEAFK